MANHGVVGALMVLALALATACPSNDKKGSGTAPGSGAAAQQSEAKRGRSAVELALARLARTVESTRGKKPEKQAYESLSDARRQRAFSLARELGRFGSKASAPALALYRRSVGHVVLRAHLLWALGETCTDEAIKALVAAIGGRSILERTAAAAVLSRCGKRVVDPLIALIREHDGKGWPSRRATDVLALVGAAAVPALVTLLDAKSPAVKRSAIGALGGIGPAARPAIDKLRPLLADKSKTNHETRRAVISALAGIGFADEAIFEQLLDALGEKKPADKRDRFDLPSLAKLSVIALARPAHVDLLAKRKGARATVVREALIGALRKLGRSAGPKGAALLRALVRSIRDPKLRHAAAFGLGVHDPRAAAYRRAIAWLLRGDNSFDSPTAFMTRVESFGAQHAALVPVLIAATKAKTHPSRRDAIRALGRIGAPARRAWPKLIKALRTDTNSQVRSAAAEAMLRIDAKRAATVLDPLVVAGTRAALGKDKATLRYAALRGLAHAWTSDAGGALRDRLTKMAVDGGMRSWEREFASKTLQRMLAPKSGLGLDRRAREKVIAALIDAVKRHGDDDTIEALGQLAATQAAEVLKGKLSPTRREGIRAAAALVRIGRHREQAFVTLVAGLKRKHATHSVLVANVIEKLGSLAAPTAPTLVAALSWEDEQDTLTKSASYILDSGARDRRRIRGAAIAALGAIGARVALPALERQVGLLGTDELARRAIAKIKGAESKR